MAKALVVIGIIWAGLGVLNLMLMPWGTTEPGSTIQTVGLMVNMLLFIIPGLILAGIGKRLGQKSDTATPLKNRLADIDQLRADGVITQAEYDQKRADILKSA